jgi:hypothetical protein
VDALQDIRKACQNSGVLVTGFDLMPRGALIVAYTLWFIWLFFGISIASGERSLAHFFVRFSFIFPILTVLSYVLPTGGSPLLFRHAKLTDSGPRPAARTGRGACGWVHLQHLVCALGHAVDSPS